MMSLEELLTERDRLKAEGHLLTSGGVGTALVGAFLVGGTFFAASLAPLAAAAGAYGVIKGRSGDSLDGVVESAIQETFDAIFSENPELKGTVFQILLSLTDSYGKPVVRDLSHLSASTGLEIETLTQTIELLSKYSLIIKVSSAENTYNVHELVARFVLGKLKEKATKSDL